MDKVEDYIFQRIRDWPVKDLIALEKALRAVIATQVNPTPPETTRERKRAKAH